MAELTNCTVELVTGRFVHVEHSPEYVEQEWVDATQAAGLMSLKRMEGAATRTARGFPGIRLHPDHVVGIYPLISRSESADEIR